MTRARLVSLPLLLLALPAQAYVRTTTFHDDPTLPTVPVQWNVKCLVIQPDSRGNKDVSLEDEESALQRSVDAWRTRTDPCGGLELSTAAPDGPLEVLDDGKQALIFRTDKWQRPGHEPYDPSAIALTTVMYVDTPGQLGDGTLTDADIEVNNVDFTFTVTADATTQSDGTLNLINTLTHELGHVQGLAHTCWDHITDTPPLDNTGLPIPDCSDPNLSPDILATVMYPFYTADDATARPLTSDDVAGVCDVYGPLTPHLGCFLALENKGLIGGGCDVGPSPTADGPVSSGARQGRDRSGLLSALATIFVLISMRKLRRSAR